MSRLIFRKSYNNYFYWNVNIINKSLLLKGSDSNGTFTYRTTGDVRKIISRIFPTFRLPTGIPKSAVALGNILLRHRVHEWVTWRGKVFFFPRRRVQHIRHCSTACHFFSKDRLGALLVVWDVSGCRRFGGKFCFINRTRSSPVALEAKIKWISSMFSTWKYYLSSVIHFHSTFPGRDAKWLEMKVSQGSARM